MERRVVMSRLLRGGQADDGSFAVAFWQRVGAEGIFAAAWEMVGERRAIRGDDGDEPRLRRAVRGGAWPRCTRCAARSPDLRYRIGCGAGAWCGRLPPTGSPRRPACPPPS